MDTLFHMQRIALKSCHEEKSVYQFKGRGVEDMRLNAVLTLFSTWCPRTHFDIVNQIEDINPYRKK